MNTWTTTHSAARIEADFDFSKRSLEMFTTQVIPPVEQRVADVNGAS